MQTLLSIIVPVYNVEQYLDRCVESIVKQTYQNIEIILVDDGSTDYSGNMCDKWAKTDPRIVVVHKENGGLSSARNAGMKSAKGIYFGFVDSDDFIEPEMYEEMMRAAMEQGKDIACCGRALELEGKRTKLEFCSGKIQVFDVQSAIKEVLLLNKMDVSSCDKIYKRQVFDKISYPEGKINEDAAIILQILDVSNGVVHVGKPFYHYVYRENSISKSKYTHKKYDAYLNCMSILSFINEKYPSLRKECQIYCTQITGRLIQAMYSNKENFKVYKSDYKVYRSMFRKGIWKTFFEKTICIKIKVRLFFVYVHLYPLFAYGLKLKRSMEQ